MSALEVSFDTLGRCAPGLCSRETSVRVRPARQGTVVQRIERAAVCGRADGVGWTASDERRMGAEGDYPRDGPEQETSEPRAARHEREAARGGAP
jgi:hypothetical protein